MEYHTLQDLDEHVLRAGCIILWYLVSWTCTVDLYVIHSNPSRDMRSSRCYYTTYKPIHGDIQKLYTQTIHLGTISLPRASGFIGARLPAPITKRKILLSIGAFLFPMALRRWEGGGCLRSWVPFILPFEITMIGDQFANRGGPSSLFSSIQGRVAPTLLGHPPSTTCLLFHN